MGFTHVSVSSQLISMVKMTPRGMSATADAYLTPVMKAYVEDFQKGFEGELQDTNKTRCQFMQSDGGLVDFRLLSGLRAILSGPAGGLVGFAKTTYDPADGKPVIGFDMGGTSTDVSRYAGKLEHVFETMTAGITIQSPQLDINTVAAGGGSILFWKNGLFNVGPDSAGAHPGPACYRKGGPLTVTDANLFLGRLLPEFFPKIFGPSEDMPLDSEIVAQKFHELTKTINQETGNNFTPEDVAIGFLNVADESVCRPIRSLTEGKGFDARDHRLAGFGGAGGQHACSVARILGIEEVVIHKYSSILSAYGMALADVVQESQEPSSEVLGAESLPRLQARMDALQQKASAQLVQQGHDESVLRFERYLNLRYKGTSTSLMVQQPSDNDFESSFLDKHRTEFSFIVPGRAILVDDIRVRGIAAEPMTTRDEGLAKQLARADEQSTMADGKLASTITKVYFQETGRIPTAVFKLGNLAENTHVEGPAIILDNTQTILVPPGATALILNSRICLRVGGGPTKKNTSLDVIDPVLLSIFGHRFMTIAEQMGLILQKTSLSMNIRERLDFSCAIFGPDGGLVANAPHIPVHLGSMQYSVIYQHQLHGKTMKPGDVFLTNSPKAGGTHLPDLTLISPVFDEEGKNILFYTAARGHHRDIGGLNGVSGHPHCTYLEQEGAVIDSFKVVSEGVFDEEGVRRIFVEEPAKYPNCTGSNSIHENLSDIKAQIAANHRGIALIQELFKEFGREVVQTYMVAIQKNAENAVRNHLKKIAKARPQPLIAQDGLDDGTEIHLKITINAETGDAVFDFTGTTYQSIHHDNGTPSLLRSAMIYVLRCVINEDVPLNKGCLDPIEIVVPDGCVLAPSPSAAVYGCNSSIANRVTDVILKAFGAAAASQGTMNGIQMCGGEESEPGQMTFTGYKYVYGESICGGSGAGPTWHGASAVHTHMTNTRAMDPEVLEKRLPVLIRRFGIRAGSGGKGLHRGGDGAIRIFEPRAKMWFVVGNDRRSNKPFGLEGGEPGKSGLNLALVNYPSGPTFVSLGPKGVIQLKPGEQFQVHTPGGGGWGAENQETSSQGLNGQISQPHQPRATGSLHQYKTSQMEG